MILLIVKNFIGVNVRRLIGSRREIGIRSISMLGLQIEGSKILSWVFGTNLVVGVVTKIALLGLLFPILRKSTPLNGRTRLRRLLISSRLR